MIFSALHKHTSSELKQSIQKKIGGGILIIYIQCM